jgi:hypothetical protein
MFCPQCERAFPRDVMVCPDCDVDTVDRLPREGPEPTPDAKLVRVFSAGDPGIIAIARSLLEGENIDYFVRGDGLQDLFAAGRLTSYNFAIGAAEFWVREDDAENVRVLLQDLLSGREGPQ